MKPSQQKSPHNECCSAQLLGVIATTCQSLFSAAISHLEAIRRSDNDPEHLHDYRVNLRKLRTLVTQLRAAFSPPQQRWLAKQLKQLSQQTNQLRDLDVYQQQLVAYQDSLPEPEQSYLLSVINKVNRQRAQIQTQLGKALSRGGHRKRIKKIETVLKDRDCFSTDLNTSVNTDMSTGINANINLNIEARLIHKKVAKLGTQIITTGRQLNAHSPPEQFHQLRIKCKKARYLVELFPGIAKAPDGLPVKRLKPLQTQLGQANDCTLQQNSLTHLMGSPRNTTQSAQQTLLPTEVIAALSVLRQRVQQKQQTSITEVLSLFKLTQPQ